MVPTLTNASIGSGGSEQVAWGLALGAAGLLALYGAEAWRARRAWATIPIRVHVNGTRGKSTVVRLLSAALRKNGVRTLAKVTGTRPTWILPDGTERWVRRRGPARIQEQLRAVLWAARWGCQAVVLECMAVDPELQWVSEHRMVRSTVGIITNVRPDHQEAYGNDYRDHVLSLANTVPWEGLLVTGDPRAAEWLEPVARRRGTALVVAGPDRLPPEWRSRLPGFEAENWAVALAAASAVGVSEATALAAMAELQPAEDALAVGRWAPSGRITWVVDALACNDVASLARALGSVVASPGEHADRSGREGNAARELPWGMVFHHRRDRPERARAFGALAARGVGDAARILPPASRVWITGEARDALVPFLSGVRGAVRATSHARAPMVVATSAREPAALLRELAQAAELPDLIVVCGNTRGAIGWRRHLSGVCWQPASAAAGSPSLSDPVPT